MSVVTKRALRIGVESLGLLAALIASTKLELVGLTAISLLVTGWWVIMLANRQNTWGHCFGQRRYKQIVSGPLAFLIVQMLFVIFGQGIGQNTDVACGMGVLAAAVYVGVMVAISLFATVLILVREPVQTTETSARFI